MASATGAEAAGGRWLSLCFLFVGLPLIVAAHLVAATWVGDLERQHRDRLASLERILHIAEAQCDTAEALERVLGRETDRALRQPVARPAILAQLRERFPRALEIVALDGEGLVQATCSDGRPSRVLWHRFFTAFRQLHAGDGALWQAGSKTWSALLGPLVGVESPAGDLTARLLAAGRNPQRADVYLSKVASSGMIVVFVHRQPEFGTLGICDWVRRSGPLLGDLRFVACDRSRPGALAVSHPEEWARDGVATEAIRVRAWFFNNPGFSVVCKERLWAHAEPQGLVHLLVWCPAPPEALPAARRGALVGVVTGLFALALFVVRRLQASGWLGRASLRLKLSGQLLFAVGVPLLLLALLAGQVAWGYREQRELQLHVAHERALRTIDAGFRMAPVQLQVRIRDALKRPPHPGESRVAAARRRLLRLRTNLGAEVEIIDTHGSMLLRVDPVLVSVLDTTRFVLVDSLRAAGVAEANQHSEGVTGVSRRIAGRSFGNLQEYPLPNGRRTVMLEQLPGDRVGAPLLAAIGWKPARLAELFLRQGLSGWQRQFGGAVLTAWHRTDPRQRVPRRSRLASAFAPLSRSLTTPGVWAMGRDPGPDQTWIVTGMRGLRLDDYVLMAASSDREITQEIAAVRVAVGLLSLVAVAISVLVGGVLARQFLRPLAALTHGVDALERRDFSVRVEVLSHDELGRLAVAFNAAVAGLGDLDVARALQEALLPAAVLRTDRVEVFGRCRPAAQVGGDFFDYRMTPGGDVAIAFGDVSGHGMAPSLVVAMAKAVFCHPHSPLTEPAALLARMNQVFADGIRHRMMMTFVAAVIDRSARSLVLSKAGQCGPLLVRAGVGTELRGMPGKPLGAGRPKPYEVLTVPLQPGDQLVFYSDGMVEAEDERGRPLDYDWVAREVPPALGDDVQLSESAIRRRHDAAVAAGPQADDISIVVARISA